jgi:hypothetical protein
LKKFGLFCPKDTGRRAVIMAAGALIAAGTIGLSPEASSEVAPEPLPSWNEGAVKRSITDFVRATTDPSSKSYILPADRIATFDQDGTLWVEHPLYAQAMFALQRIYELASQHSKWLSTEPFKSVLAGKQSALAGSPSGIVLRLWQSPILA